MSSCKSHPHHPCHRGQKTHGSGRGAISFRTPRLLFRCVSQEGCQWPITPEKPTAFFPRDAIEDSGRSCFVAPYLLELWSMRVLFFVLVGVLLLVDPAFAQSSDLSRRFEAANQAYAQGQYDRAATFYEKLLDADYESGALYYNLANTYVRLDRWGAAIRYYEKANRLLQDESRVQHNLEQARRRAGIYGSGRLVPEPGIRSVVRGWSPLLLFTLGWLAFTGGVGFAVVWGREEDARGAGHPLVWGLVGTGLLVIIAAFGVSYVQSLDHSAVVVAEQAPLHAAPTGETAADTTVSEGVMLEVQGRQSSWTEVRLPDGRVGWVPTRALGDV